jgi:hypothetical protein
MEFFKFIIIHLPNYSELGEIYSELGKYEDAEKEFIVALSEEKYPNYQHKMYTLRKRANNSESPIFLGRANKLPFRLIYLYSRNFRSLYYPQKKEMKGNDLDLRTRLL